MRVEGFGVCGPNEKYLEQTLKEFDRLCDHTTIVLNNTDDKSRELIESYGFSTITDNRVWGENQWRIKEEAIRSLNNPDWVICLDMDEVFDSTFTRSELERLAEKGGTGYFFYIVNLYDEGYSKEWSFWNVRMFKYEEPLDFEQKALHCGLVPRWHWRWANYAPFILEHSGLKDKADRDRKVERYQRFDPNARHKGRAYYDFLSSQAPVSWYNKDELRIEVEDFVSQTNHKEPTMSETNTDKRFFYVRNPAGQLCDIPEKDLKETLARDGFTLVSEKPVEKKSGAVEHTEVVEEPVEEPKEEKKEGFECEECGFVSKSKGGLTLHAKKH